MARRPLAKVQRWLDGSTAPRLVVPDIAYESSYRSYVEELAAAEEVPVPFVLRLDHGDFGLLVRRLHALETNAEGFVPNSTYWLVHDDEIVAVSNLRHRLNDRLRQHGGHIGYGVRPSARRRGYGTEVLRLTLQRARARGIDCVLVTCDKGNTASARVAHNNGGVLSWEGQHRDGDRIDQHYWINSSDS